MCFGGDDAPPPPDPVAVAAAQAKANKETAQEQARLAMTGQTSDQGSLTYVKDPSSPSGYRAVQTLAPESQALLAQQRDIQANAGDVTNTALNNVSGAISTPFDLQAARGREISDIQQTFLDPQWSQSQDALENQLLNKGIRPGSEQYEIARRQFGQQKSDAYNKMFLDAFNVANNAALTQRNLPLSDYSTLAGTVKQVAALPGVTTPSPSVAPTDIVGPTYASYNAANANAQNQTSGLYNLAGTIGSAAVMASDRRIKRGIKRIGTAGNGLPLYEFRYAGQTGTHRGFMADEVRALRPEAVITIDGIDHVDYLKAVI